MASALQYIEQTLICAEIVRLLPKWIAPYVLLSIARRNIELTRTFSIVGTLLGRRLKAQDVVFGALLPIAELRCEERDLKKLGQPVPQHVCVCQILQPRLVLTRQTKGRLYSVDHGDPSAPESLVGQARGPRADGYLVRLRPRSFYRVFPPKSPSKMHRANIGILDYHIRHP